MTHANNSAIAKAICKSRTLSPENAVLFYDVSNTNLHFTDATRTCMMSRVKSQILTELFPGLTPDALTTLGSLNPNLVNLRLDLCGRITGAVLDSWATSLRQLRRIELYGPFLVRTDAWKAFFAAHPQLEGFLITQSPRFDLACMEALVEHCPEVHELRLKEVGKLNDAFADAIASMCPSRGWTLLDLADPSTSLSGPALVRLLEAVGPTVKELDLSGHEELTDKVLRDGLHAHARQLTHLRLANCLTMTDYGVATLFTDWANPPLRVLDLARNADLAGGALEALLAHSAATLRTLSLNGWRGVPADVLSQIGETCARVERLDLSWCREVDDFVVKALLDGCTACKELQVWACNRLTSACPRKRGVSMPGVEVSSG
jgi:DNA repair protein RAD7